MTNITIGSCTCYDEFEKMYQDWEAVGDRILAIVAVVPYYKGGTAELIKEWYLKWGDAEHEDVIHVCFVWWGENGGMLCTYEFPAKYLFMSDDDILADLDAKRKAEEAAKQKEERDARYREFLALKEKYLELKMEFEPESDK